MKKVLFFAFALMFSIGVSAQESKKTPQPNGDPQMTFREGKVWVTENNKETELTADRRLPDGTIVTPAGVVTTPDGTSETMVEGDALDLQTYKIRKSTTTTTTKTKDAKKK